MQTAPFYAEAADGPEGGLADWVQAADGVKLRIGHWALKDGDCKGTVLLFPGRTEYIEKYGRAARDFAARGFAMAAIDWRGQGLADRLLPDRSLGHVGAFLDYQHDVAAMLDYARAQNLPEPYYLVAHSMGGAIGLRALMDGLDVKAAAFSGPMWGIAMSRMMRPVAHAIAAVARPLGLADARAPMTDAEAYVLTADLDDNTLTRDADMISYMRTHLEICPDLSLSGPTIHWVNQALGELRDLAAQKAPELPCFCAMGTNERIVDTTAIKLRMANWPDGALKTYTGGEHEIMMEVPATRADFFDRCAALFSQHSA
ncbi:MAG: alpha/beta hydrolase [Pseudomonadota bacterium]